MTDLTASRSGLKALVQATSDLSGLPVRVIDDQGRSLADSQQDTIVSDVAFDPPDETQVKRPLPSGLTLILGPLRPEQRVIGRFLVDRIAAAVTVAARQDEAVRPRGSRRVEAIEALLAGKSESAGEQRAAALALGLDPDGMYIVAVTSGENDVAATNALAPLGSLHEAGEVSGRRTALVAASGLGGSNSLAGKVAAAKRRWQVETKGANATLAISAPASGVGRLPAAAREAELIARLQAETGFPHRAASFDSIDDVGAFQLLYPLRDTSELRAFVAEALGTLEHRDQRGTLCETLRAYLQTGGSHAEASKRLGIHRNTLAYRLRRIGELIGRDIGDPNSWLTLHLALQAADLLRVISDEP